MVIFVYTNSTINNFDAFWKRKKAFPEFHCRHVVFLSHKACDELQNQMPFRTFNMICNKSLTYWLEQASQSRVSQQEILVSLNE